MDTNRYFSCLVNILDVSHWHLLSVIVGIYCIQDDIMTFSLTENLVMQMLSQSNSWEQYFGALDGTLREKLVNTYGL